MKRAPNRLHGSRCGMDGETGGSAIASLGFSPFSYRLPKTKNIINGWVVRVQPKIYRRVYFEGKRKTTEREITVYRKTTSNDGNPWLLVGSRKKTPAERNTAGPGAGIETEQRYRDLWRFTAIKCSRHSVGRTTWMTQIRQENRKKNILLQCLFFLNILLCTCQIRAVIKRKEQRGRDGRPPWRSKVYRLLTNAGWASAIHVRVWATPTLRRRENAQGTREEASRSVEIQSRSGAGAQAHQSNTGINTSTALKTRSSRVVAPFCA